MSKKGFVIVAKFRGQAPEVVDHTDSERDAVYLRSEYAMAYGQSASVSWRPATVAEAREHT